MNAKTILSPQAAGSDPEKSAGSPARKAGSGVFLREMPEIAGAEAATESAQDCAEYIAVLASQLQRIAQANGHQFLAYLIEMAVIEAWRIADPDADRPDDNN